MFGIARAVGAERLPGKGAPTPPANGAIVAVAATIAIAMTAATTPLGWESRASAQMPKVADGFEIRLVAAVPAVQYPCQIATAPDGSLFVAENPMDQTGPANKPIDRILLFRDGREPTVFAENLAAVFGMAWRDGALYVMHMPYLSVLRDLDGDGKADSREDLFTNLGLNPGEPNMLNDHIVSGIQFGIDGRLYISVGDKGVPRATGPDGREVRLVGGGILRCDPDGRNIEVFSSGTRNHLEPNLDDADRLFTYDNTDDGDGWWTRVTYHIDGGYYGYPYDYHNHTRRMLPRMAEYGGGSPCGGVVYKEDAWPENFRGRALWAEWGKRHVAAFAFEPEGAGYRVRDVVPLVEAGEVGDFRPIDLALSHDGRTLYIADWAMGGWGSKTEKVGRVFAVTPKTPVETAPRGSDDDPIADQIRALDHPAHAERVRAQGVLIRKGEEALKDVLAALADPAVSARAGRHLVWIVDRIVGGDPRGTFPIIDALRSPRPEIRAQAARALGLRRIPIAAEPLAPLVQDPSDEVRLQAIIALGRIGDHHATETLVPVLGSTDPYIEHAARAALRRIGDWEGLARGLRSDDPAVRAGTARALELVHAIPAARALADFVSDSAIPEAERALALEYLAEGHRKTAPWDGKWWGTRPTQGRPFPKVVEWEGTALIAETVRRSVASESPEVRRAAVSAARVIGDPALAAGLRDRHPNEPDSEIRVAILRALTDLGDAAAAPLMIRVVKARDAEEAERAAALAGLGRTAAKDPDARTALCELVASDAETPDVHASILDILGELKAVEAAEVVSRRLANPASPPATRAAAARALGRIGIAPEARGPLRAAAFAADVPPETRKAAIDALGALRDRESVRALVEAAGNEETRFEAAMALARVPDLAALPVYLRGLADRSPELRAASASALSAVKDDAAPVLARLHERAELAPSAIPALREIYAGMIPIRDWRILGPFPRDVAEPFPVDGPVDFQARFVGKGDRPVRWKRARPVDDLGQIDLAREFSPLDEVAAFGIAEIDSRVDREAEFSVGSDDTLAVWVNGEKVYDFRGNRGFEHDQARFKARLRAGTNLVAIRCDNAGGGWQFAVRHAGEVDYPFLRTPAPDAFNPDVFREFALREQGDPERGAKLFADERGLACAKCHVVAGVGGKVGPELSDIGVKYPRAEIIEAILQPSAKISSGYEAVVILTLEGRVLNGILKADEPDAVEIETADAERVRVPRDDIDEIKPSDVSLMPNGLAEGLTPRDFADLISYLSTLRGNR